MGGPHGQGGELKGRFLTVPFVLLAVFLAAVGGIAAAFHIRSRQVEFDQNLSQAWSRLGNGLREACERLHQPPEPVFEPRELAKAVADTAIQAKLGVIGTRIDSICRARDSAGRNAESLDSLRESVRRDRENLGLALARYREGMESIVGKRILVGFPVR